jgi:hypothetical protein
MKTSFFLSLFLPCSFPEEINKLNIEINLLRVQKGVLRLKAEWFIIVKIV